MCFMFSICQRFIDARHGWYLFLVLSDLYSWILGWGGLCWYWKENPVNPGKNNQAPPFIFPTSPPSSSTSIHSPILINIKISQSDSSWLSLTSTRLKWQKNAIKIKYNGHSLFFWRGTTKREQTYPTSYHFMIFLPLLSVGNY